MGKKLARTELTLPADFLTQLTEFFQGSPYEMFHVPRIRDAITLLRLESVSVDDMEVADQIDPAAVSEVLEYNKEMLRKIENHAHTLKRPSILINVLTSIFYVGRNTNNLKILCIGPRTESEIFMLLAAGFDPHNITGLDLISYSDFVDVGDMHAMPYEDDSFDIVFVGWTLTYSTDLQRVADECVRVAKPGAYVAVGVERPPTLETADLYGYSLNDAPQIRSTDEIVALFGDHVYAVPFRHDAHRSLRDTTVEMVMVVIELQ